ncbi:uncharacterized protein V6R79_025068 [Siganus canaliculatus]
MKMFVVAVAVVIGITLICFQESSAVPVTEGEEAMRNDHPAGAYNEMPEESWQMPYHNRHKRLSRAAPGCRWCCNCCQLHGACGFCCDF